MVTQTGQKWVEICMRQLSFHIRQVRIVSHCRESIQLNKLTKNNNNI